MRFAASDYREALARQKRLRRFFAIVGAKCEAQGVAFEVETGVFGARMQLELVNDGPVTISLDV